MTTSSSPKTKLTLSIDKQTLANAKEYCQVRQIPISRLVENFLNFASNPELYCFKCGKNFSSSDSEICPKCGWLICPKCERCRCSLTDDTAVAVYHMRRVYENLLGGRVK